MIFTIVSILIPLLIYFFLPQVVQRLNGKNSTAKPILIIACALFFISWYLPSPLIHGQNTQFTTHFIGGGLFTGFLWLYLIKNMPWKLSRLQAFLLLYFLVSGLGVANELFESFLAETGFVEMGLADTSWDLVANTSGALLFWLLYSAYDLLGKKTSQR
jgi:hypothetical protein